MPKGYALSEEDEGWDLGAASARAERGERSAAARLPRATVSRYLARVGGIRPRPRRRAARCLTLDEREEISRAIAGGHSARAIARTWGAPTRRSAVRSTAAAGGGTTAPTRGARGIERGRGGRGRPSSSSLPSFAAGRERFKEDNSPEQIAGWLRLEYPENEAMRVSHETIYRALYVQARGTLRRELTHHLRRGRSRRYAARSRQSARARASSPTW